MLRDERGREIEPGDVLKVFHFTGARRKRHYMYKQAVGYVTLSKKVDQSPPQYLKISHLNRADGEEWEIGKNFYLEAADGRTLAGYEIMQRKG
jgi:hypothetical protein